MDLLQNLLTMYKSIMQTTTKRNINDLTVYVIKILSVVDLAKVKG